MSVFNGINSFTKILDNMSKSTNEHEIRSNLMNQDSELSNYKLLCRSKFESELLYKTLKYIILPIILIFLLILLISAFPNLSNFIWKFIIILILYLFIYGIYMGLIGNIKINIRRLNLNTSTDLEKLKQCNF